MAYIETQGSAASLKSLQKSADVFRIPVADLFKDVPRPKKDPVDDAARRFSHLIKDTNPGTRAAILEVVRPLTRNSRKTGRFG